ncbi:MAG: DUF1501 domain-containing protein [Planctomycetota bacterium]|nr:MAG: DUF1501 domain-containing protein [Planctomycetota bacterium]
MHPIYEYMQLKTRRYFLRDAACGLGALALGTLAGTPIGQGGEPSSAAPLGPHFTPRAKRVIYLHMTGSPPNLDLFDYKPVLNDRHGEDCPSSFLAGREFAFTSGVPTLLGSPQKFRRVGRCGTWMSEAIGHLHSVADDMCRIHSMYSDQFNHAPAELLIYTGSPRAGRPSMGSWVTYGLGSENEDLPAFVVLISSGVQPNGGKSSFGAGFLPSVYQGVQCRSKGDPVLFTSNPPGMDRHLRRATLDALNKLNQVQVEAMGHPETQTRIAQFELAFRMQTSVPEVMDISQEPQSVLDAYGAEPGASSLANNCLLARRLVESGVRFVQLFDWGWDFHGTRPDSGIGDGLVKKCATMDRPVAALIEDLRARGLLDDTLIVWGGEFGRTPFREGRTAKSQILGRDHYPDCFTMWMAGGGVKPGFDYGQTDELGFQVTEQPVHVHDLQATILHLLGFDHTRLTFRFQGRDYRLTDVHGQVVHDLLA